MEPPPGYNPNVSLLNGGDTNIVPVQGGGAMLSESYNPNVSLLNGGDTNIVPVRGGANENKIKGGSDYTIKSIDLISSSGNTIAEKEFDLKQIQIDYDTYIKSLTDSEKNIWKPLKLNDGTFDNDAYIKQNVFRTTYNKCKSPFVLSDKMMDLSSRTIELINTDNAIIWLVQPMDGNINTLNKVLNIISPSNQTLDINTYVIFLPEISSLNKKPVEFLPYYQRLFNFKTANPGHVFFLQSRTKEAVGQSCKLFSSLFGTDTSYVSKKTDSDDLLPYAYDANVIVFIQQKIIFSTTSLPVRKDANNIRLSEILKKFSPTFPFAFSITPTENDSETIDDFFEISFKPKSEVTNIQFDAKTKSLDLSSLISPITLDDTIQCYKFEKKEGEEKEKEENEEKEEKEENIIKPQYVYVETATKFEGTNENDNENINQNGNEIIIDNKKFKIRSSDWLNQDWSESEADFLNTLKLSPVILEHIYKEEWKQTLADVLKILSQSKCLQDSKLLLKTECNLARDFFKKVYLEIYVQNLLNLTTSWSDNKEVFEDSLLPNTSNSNNINVQNVDVIENEVSNLNADSKINTNLNLLEQGETVYPNIENPGKHVLNFSEVSNNSRDKIKRLEREIRKLKARTLRRIIGKNQTNVTDKYTRYKKKREIEKFKPPTNVNTNNRLKKLLNNNNNSTKKGGMRKIKSKKSTRKN